MTNEKLITGNDLSHRTELLERRLRDTNRGRSKIIDKRDGYFPSEEEHTIQIVVADKSIELNEERLLVFLKEEIKIVGELLEKTKKEFNDL